MLGNHHPGQLSPAACSHPYDHLGAMSNSALAVKCGIWLETNIPATL